MKKHKLAKTILASAIIIPAIVSIQVPSTEAATTTQIASAVQKAISASQVLRRATSIDYNGDGKTRPYTEYNNTKDAYAKASTLVKSMPASNTKISYEAKLDEVKLQITRAQNYIDAISAGEAIVKKKNLLQAHVDKGLLSAETLALYNSLSYEIKKQSKIIYKVHGYTTRMAIKDYYQIPAEKLRNQLIYPVTVKAALIKISSGLSNQDILSESKKVLLFLPAVPQQGYKKQLASEWESMKGKVTVSIQDADYKNLAAINDHLKELETIIKPGVSSSKVPSLYEETRSGITEVGNALAKQEMGKALSNVMGVLILPVSEIKTLLTKQAAEKGIPPEIVKAIALTENGSFQQFMPDGEVFKSFDNGFGIMQVTPLSENDTRYDWDKVKYDISYNIETGINILLEKWGYGGSRIPVVNDGQKDKLENWYFAVMAYNGLAKKNDPNVSAGTPYQEKVYANLSAYTGKTPELIKKEDLKITYNQSTGQMLFNDKMNYTTSKVTISSQLYKTGDIITLPIDSIRLRSLPSTEGELLKTLPKGTAVTIIGGPIEDQNKMNLFTWYKVKVNATGQTGYIASVW